MEEKCDCSPRHRPESASTALSHLPTSEVTHLNTPIYNPPHSIMNCDWMPSQARVEDSSAIASLLALSWASPFARLQFGRVDPLALTAAMTPRIAQQIAHPNAEFIVLRNPDTQEVVSVAQWSLPSEAADVAEETQEEQDEHHDR